MTVSEKQLEANRQNAQLGGVKTPEGKEIVKYNALKHGLLAKEIFIPVGEGAENPEEFNALIEALDTQFKPVGVLEEMLVEKIAVAYWRLRRAYRYEAGLIRDELDNATDDYYGKTDWEGKKKHKTDEEINQEVREEQENLENWKQHKIELEKMHEFGKPLEETFEREEVWDWFYDDVHYLLPQSGENEPLMTSEETRAFLNKKYDWDDDYIWQQLIGVCAKQLKLLQQQIDGLNNQIIRNERKLQVIKKLGSIPSKEELDRLLRYEGAIERQLYKAINQLERQQRMRSGETVPAPIVADVDVNTGQGS